jgi:orotidine-5'-phosphate decarboxylase
MTRQQLIHQIKQKKSYLCVGLDTDITKIPKHLQGHPEAIVEFNKAIIDATKDVCVGYKINTAFYEAMGVKGWEAMEKTVNYIPKEHFTIADAKRGDIGNTSSQYAKAFFETLNFDSLTVAPYMGEDSVKPFLQFDGKWAIVLGLTSNEGSKDFEQLRVVGENSHNGSHKFLYETVLQKISSLGTTDNLMFVIGATKAEEFANIRKLIPDHFLLVPGIGFQGGSLADVSKHGMIKNSLASGECGLLVNVSRAIIYASEKEDFAQEARAIAQQYQAEMATYL